jgi:two-component system cell cycle sensor histidine kinase/response regulator CckA
VDRKPTREDAKQSFDQLENVNARNGQAGEKSEPRVVQEWGAELLSRLFSMSPVPMVLSSLTDAKVLKINHAVERLSGYTEAEIKGQSFVEIKIWFSSQDRAELIKDLLAERFLENRKIQFLDRFGETRSFLLSAEIIEFQDEPCILSMAVDTTERWRAEEALEKSEVKYRKIADSIPGVVYQFLLKKDGSYACPFMSESAALILDISVEEIMADAMALFGMIVEEDLDPVNRSIAESARTMSTWMHEFRIRDTKGNIRWIRATSTPHRLPNEEIIWDGVLLDISDRVRAEEALRTAHNDLEKRVEERTAELAEANKKLLSEINERKQIETALRESEARYRELANSLPQIVFEVDETGNLTFVNHNAYSEFGYTADDFEKGLNALQTLVPEDRARALENIQKMLGGQTFGGVEYTALRKDGSTFPVFIHSNRIMRQNSPVGIRGIIINLTERKQDEREKRRLETRLQRAEKMEAIGTLAGGVAHDLNNVLTGIVSYPDFLLMQLPEDSTLREPIMTIRRAGEKAAAIVQDLLTLARRGVAVNEVVNLNDIISEFLTSPEYKKLLSYHPNVEAGVNLDEGVLHMLGSPVHLSKTVMNLVSNAAEAMPEGGKMLISTENRYINRPVRGYDEVIEGDYVLFTVSDTGTGVAADDLERIFEPFYTKKAMGRSGTGLGMAVVWGTVKDHKGYIDVQSIEGEGTTCFLYFPITRREPVRELEGVAVTDFRGAGESILVIDDVKEQREIAHIILSELGYSVSTVPSGEEAIEFLKTNAVDLLILDMIMSPGIDGLETYRRILDLHPGQKAIIASGFSETNRVREAQALGAGKYVKKPYKLENISRAVKEELNR